MHCSNVYIIHQELPKTSCLSQLMRLWYLSHRRPAQAQAGLRIRAVSPEWSLFANIKYGSSRRIRPKIRHLAPLDGCACVFEEWVYGRRKYNNLMRWLICFFPVFSDMTSCIELYNSIADSTFNPNAAGAGSVCVCVARGGGGGLQTCIAATGRLQFYQ